MARSSATKSIMAAAVVALAACSGGAQEPGRAAAAAAPSPPARPSPLAEPMHSLPRLAFFMNPAGAPCVTQDRILREMSAELAGRAELVYYRTTDPADLPRFAQYGIRSLPLLVVTDAAGRELRRATPGIQGADQIRRLLALR
jgi:thioredoxin 1